MKRLKKSPLKAQKRRSNTKNKEKEARKYKRRAIKLTSRDGIRCIKTVVYPRRKKVLKKTDLSR
jgi:hypothetical protein